MGRTLVVLTGVLVGFVISMAGVGLGVLSDILEHGAASAVAVFEFAAGQGEQVWISSARHGATMLWLVAVVLCLAPVALTAAIGEITGLREPTLYAGLTGGLSAAVPIAVRALAMPATAPASHEEARLEILVFLAGAASGVGYWAVAVPGSVR